MVSLQFFQDKPDEQSGCGGCEANGGDEARCGNGLEKIYNTTAVRYGYMKYIGEFTRPASMQFSCGAKVVIQTRRGIELGDQVSLSCNGCDKHVSREQIKRYIENSGSDSYHLDNGRIMREATPADLVEHAKLVTKTKEMKRFAQERAGTLRLKLKLVECEYLFGGERAIFYFLSDERVDFRDLVKDLVEEFQTRIKMHQVGARDEARLLADYETCGREVCCKVFLKSLKPISMKMAKLQRATLDPSKVSGRCGRLKCCLRYEHTSYLELDAALPRVGEKIQTTFGYATVINRQILTQLVQVQQREGGVETVVNEDVIERKLSSFPAVEPKPAPSPPPAKPAAESTQARSRRPRPPRQRAASKPQDSPVSQPLSKKDESEQTTAPEGGSGENAQGGNDKPAPGNELSSGEKQRPGRRRRSRRGRRGRSGK